MVVAFVLIHVTGGKGKQVYEALTKVAGVKEVHNVTGPYDVIAYVDLPDRSEYRSVIFEIHEIPGVAQTETCIAL
ncbi:Lrp/AsnC family transcriptional regulator [Candidatus Thorarchaeota archaeon]|jgi:DNA-binding Lrp family transcriptional regulator|nr:MAG: Lrp/AsnC family transcriptional regulator [Candidatus Thorarchaeota archaeon]